MPANSAQDGSLLVKDDPVRFLKEATGFMQRGEFAKAAGG